MIVRQISTNEIDTEFNLRKRNYLSTVRIQEIQLRLVSRGTRHYKCAKDGLSCFGI